MGRRGGEGRKRRGGEGGKGKGGPLSRIGKVQWWQPYAVVAPLRPLKNLWID